MIPDDNDKFVFNNGLKVPLGRIVQAEKEKNSGGFGFGYGSTDSEYVIFTPEQVKLRYMVEFN
jgi:hypothetical protein